MKTQYRCLSLHGFLLLSGLAIPALGLASLKIITLSELVQKSDLIARGHLQRVSPESPRSSGVASMHPISVLKGEVAKGENEIPLCNGRVDSENPDLATLAGDYVAFVAKRGRCFYLVWGWDSLIAIRADQAHTSGIEDQPIEQPVEDFLRKIRSLLK